MINQLPNEIAVLAAVRRLLAAHQAGHDAAGMMASLTAETSLLPLNNLDAWERKIRDQLGAIEQQPKLIEWRLWSKPHRFASWLDLCSGDGFARERILRSSSEGVPNSFFCALALRRLNDWVPEVRAAARERLGQIAKRSAPESVADALWSTFANCSSWGRMEDAERKALADLLLIKQVALALKFRILQATAGPTTLVLSQAGRAPSLDEWLGEFARGAIQPSVRAKAYRCLPERRMVWVVGRTWRWTDPKWCKGRFEPEFGERAISDCGQATASLKAALADRSPLVRRVGAEFLIKQSRSIGADAFMFAEQLASDSCPTIAERGRFVLAMLSDRL